MIYIQSNLKNTKQTSTWIYWYLTGISGSITGVFPHLMIFLIVESLVPYIAPSCFPYSKYSCFPISPNMLFSGSKNQETPHFSPGEGLRDVSRKTKTIERCGYQ